MLVPAAAKLVVNLNIWPNMFEEQRQKGNDQDTINKRSFFTRSELGIGGHDSNDSR